MNSRLCFALSIGALIGVCRVSNAQQAGETAAVSNTGYADPAASFSAFAAQVSADKNTEYAAETFWRQWRGRQVIWTADVSEVRAGNGHCDIYLAVSSEPLYRGYNIVADTRDMLGSQGLKKGDRIQVAGLLHRYRARIGQPVIVTLSEARIVSPVPQSGAGAVLPPPSVVKPVEVALSLEPVNVPPATLKDALADCAAFITSLDPSQNTELAAESNWRALRPYQVTWTATVQQVDGTSGGAEIFLSCGNLLTYRGYNVILVTRDRLGAAALVKGQKVTFVGLPHRYTFRIGRPTVVTLREGQFVPSK